jgi:predicted HAD superfamily Cof-like phosphohydrolase
MTKLTDGLDELQRECLAQFFAVFNASTDVMMWQDLIYEEAKEVITAINAEDRLKECVDLAYVCAGLLTAMDLEGNIGEEDLRPLPEYEVITVSAAEDIISTVLDLVGVEAFDEAFKRVHASNMSKLGEDGKPLRRADGKILKGPNYKPPVLADLVIQAPTTTLN